MAEGRGKGEGYPSGTTMAHAFREKVGLRVSNPLQLGSGVALTVIGSVLMADGVVSYVLDGALFLAVIPPSIKFLLGVAYVIAAATLLQGVKTTMKSTTSVAMAHDETMGVVVVTLALMAQEAAAKQQYASRRGAIEHIRPL